jgi:endo-1,3(4)-beta-glucanase
VIPITIITDHRYHRYRTVLTLPPRTHHCIASTSITRHHHYLACITGKANIEFTFPVKASTEEELRLNFNWHPAYMTDLRGEVPAVTTIASGNPRVELLMYATPHHQGRLEPAVGSSNAISDAGCVPTIHGVACPVTGGFWCTVEHLHRIGFNATRPVREDMLPGLRKALKTDIHFAIPENYMHGAGDTYFSGKILAKLARILLIADETGVDNNGGDGKVSTEEFDQALDRLRKGTTIWLSSKAESRLLYDASWGGIVMCGCDFDDESQRCSNKFPDCPALTDAGSNFGAGFYNDHHFHFGYHIFAAAVVAKFDHQWGRKHFQRALMLVRDIANPSTKDPFFPAWRHKDWYLGFSWASGVVTIQGQPYPNGRNQESSSEAIAAYESVALFGQSFVDIYKQSADPAEMALLDTATRIREMGRLLLATEIRSAKTYWHVQKAGTSGVFRVYPRGYEPKVVGMIWSMLAQQQTWFGNEPWKSYGIQLMPLTPAAEQRDAPSWVQEMLPLFKESCFADPQCVEQGWSISIYACMAELGQWREANEHVHQLDPAVFESAGGNGHSLSNTLWYIGTRPEPTAEDFAMGNGYTSVRQYGDYY